MRNYPLIIGFLLLMSCNKKLTIPILEPLELNASNRSLVGTWEFVKILNKESIKIDTIWHGMGFELANGPLLTYKDDGTYIKKFTPKNSDSGYWSFDTNSGDIVHQLYIDSTEWIGQDLIKRGLAIKFSDGNYYEEIRDKVVIESESELVVFGRNEIQRIYKKLTPNKTYE